MVRFLRPFLDNPAGSSAVEFALAAVPLVFGLLNSIDVGYYTYQRMEVENAAQAGAQAAWATCNDSGVMLPATQNCAGLGTAISTAIQSTSLGAGVVLTDGSPTEGYYCVDSTGNMQAVGTLSSKPGNCSAAGNPNVSPGDYIQVGVTFPYAPLFPGVTVMSAWGITSIDMTSWMRLG